MRVVALVLAGGLLASAAPEQPRFRTLNDRFTPPVFTSAAEWQRRAAWLREHILFTAGLSPMPVKTPLRAHVFDERARERYSISKVYFESLPGFYVTGNLYRPIGAGPFPAVLAPHGHWYYGRLENTALNSVPARAINLAEQGFVVLTHDMIGYNDSRQLTHTFGSQREHLWGLSLAGLQLWNSIRAVDFLQSLSYVDRDRIAATGESGGGTQTFLLAAVDERIKVAAPVNMISLHMQGGCLCENQPGLRLDTNNVEIAATIAPRPLLMVSATGDWTKETLEVEYPAMRRMYALVNAEDRVHSVRFDAPHNYNEDSREAVYAWLARWLKGAPADVRVEEREFRARELGAPSELLVFYGRPMPADALTQDQVVAAWIAAARKQLAESDPKQLQAALLHALALDRSAPPARSRTSSKGVVMAGDDASLHAALTRSGFTVTRVAETPFDAAAAAKINHFDTYNRTAASQRVADIVATLRQQPHAMLVATGEGGLPALLALAVVPVAHAFVDVSQFDNTSDAAFLERLYIPGLRRAGDLQTAVSMATGAVVVHNAGDRFTLDEPGTAKALPHKGGAAQGLSPAIVRIERRKLTPAEIASALKRPGRHLSSRASQTAR